MKNKKALLTAVCLFLCAAIFLSACGAGKSPDNKKAKINAVDLMRGIKSTNAYYLSSYCPEAEDYAAVADFAVRLFGECAVPGKNTLVSPLSVMSALSLAANGAKGETLSQTEKVLGLPVDKLNIMFYGYMNGLPDEEKCRIKIADSVWFTDDKNFNVNNDFLQTNAEYHNAAAYKAPFDDVTLKDINNWVKNNTDGMIPEIIDEIPDDTVMFLINALAFEAEWQEPYFENQVRKEDFTCGDGAKKKTDFMFGKEHEYIQDENATGFIKYYYGGRYAFAALLPDEGTDVYDYAASLTGKKLQSVLKSGQSVTVYTSVPKFKQEFSTDLSKTLKNMGMPLAFDAGAADLSRLGSYKGMNLYISRVLHKTYISVSENGTKAGAATAVAVDKNAIMPDPSTVKRVYLDRPFIYMLIDTETCTPFFIGAVTKL